MKSRGTWGALALVILMGSTEAGAVEPIEKSNQGKSADTLAGQASTDGPFAAARRMGVADLAKITGRDDTALVIRANNTSTVANNSVSGHSETGTVTFDGQAFGNLSGLSLVSANTGNNVSINSSLNLNVSIRP